MHQISGADACLSATTTPLPRRRSGRRRLAGAVSLALVAGGAILGTATSAVASTSYAVIGTVTLPSAGGDIALIPGTTSAYVSRGGGNAISVVDLSTEAVTGTISVPSPGRIAVDPGTHRAYVISAGGLAVIDTTTNTVVGTISGFSNPIDVALDPTTHLAYVTNLNSEVVSVVDTTASPATITNTGYVGSRPWAIGVDPTTHKAYASTLFGNTLATVSGTSVVSSTNGFAGPVVVTVDPSLNRVYVINNNADVVTEVDTTTDATSGYLSAGHSPGGIGVDPATHIAYVSNRGDNTVSVIDQNDDSIIATVPVGPSPTVVRVDPTTHRVYVANSDGTLSVLAPLASQTITFGTAPAEATVGHSATVSATGGGSTQPVTFSVDPSTTNNACSITGSIVSFDHAGSCVVAANQAGDNSYSAAPTATQTIPVALNATSTTLSPPAGVVFGQPATASVAVSGTHDGSVQFSLDGSPVGAPVALGSDGTATSPDLGSGLTVGSHPVGAAFLPTDGATYADSSATPQSLVVDKAATTSTVAVDPDHVSATVSPTAPGAGVPTGTVHFYVAGTEVGTAPLSSGTATLTHQVPAGSTRQVSTTYAGDGSFTGSSASTARRDPVITATLWSAHPPRNGWYAGPVTVRFSCSPTSAALTAPCPAPVSLSRNAAAQSVTRTVTATDGGAATATATANIDRVSPIAQVIGVRAGATYFASGPRAQCRATDALSGIASCTVSRTTRENLVSYVATAIDRAGNRGTSRRLVVRTSSITISDAGQNNDHFVVHRGRTYQVLVAATTRPTYEYASPSPRHPAGGGIPFTQVGHDRWALGVTFTQAMRYHRMWNIGTRVGTHTIVTKVLVVP